MYKIQPQPYFFISSRIGEPAYASRLSPYWCLHDRPKKCGSQKILERYISDAEIIFVGKVACLSDFKKPFMLEDENNICNMLELLIDARRILEEVRVS